MLKSKRNHKPGKMDECQTPGYAIDPLLEYLSIKDDFIVDPACGDGFLLRRFRELGFRAGGDDIKSGYNFLDESENNLAKSIVFITNPPFSRKYQFLEKCYELDQPFALLMPVETIGAKSAQDLFKRFGIDIIWMDKRVNFKMPFKEWTGLGSHFSCAWFTWRLVMYPMTFYSCDHWTKEYRKQFEY